MIKPSDSHVTRRQFVAGSLAAFGVSSLVTSSTNTYAATDLQGNSFTVQQIIDLILGEIPGGQVEKTVDTIKAGKPDQLVTGVVTTMFATVEVIRKAIELKANFIIAHEPTFYNHLDETAWLQQDKVYTFKRDLLEKYGIAVWRFHDYWHRHNPDGVRMGVLTNLGWERYYDSGNPGVVTIPVAPLKDVINHVKEKLGIKNLRFIGDPAQPCQRVLLMPGASGGRSQIQAFQNAQPDVLICGEVAEWETSEYIRDALAMGEKRSLIVLGHAQSEEPGMQWLVSWLQPKIPGVKVSHVASNNPFTWG
jgi:putative NIF3 family GTP cyclohydrolase 1 type 2